MKYITATETKNNLAGVIDIARREPVTIQRNGRSIIVMMAVEDYERLSTQMIRNFQNFCDQAGYEATAQGLTEDKLNALLNNND